MFFLFHDNIQSNQIFCFIASERAEYPAQQVSIYKNTNDVLEYKNNDFDIVVDLNGLCLSVYTEPTLKVFTVIYAASHSLNDLSLFFFLFIEYVFTGNVLYTSSSHIIFMINISTLPSVQNK